MTDKGPATEAGRSLMRQWIGHENEAEVRIVILAIEQEAAAKADEGRGTDWHYCDFDSPHHLAAAIDVERLAEAMDYALNDTSHWTYRFDRLELAQILARKVVVRLATPPTDTGFYDDADPA